MTPHLAFSVRHGWLWQDVCTCRAGHHHPLGGRVTGEPLVRAARPIRCLP